MYQFHHGKQLKSVVAHRPGPVRRKRWHLVSYGYPIMQYRDVPVARQNFGLADESITVGMCVKCLDDDHVNKMVLQFSLLMGN